MNPTVQNNLMWGMEKYLGNRWRRSIKTGITIVIGMPNKAPTKEVIGPARQCKRFKQGILNRLIYDTETSVYLL